MLFHRWKSEREADADADTDTDTQTQAQTQTQTQPQTQTQTRRHTGQADLEAGIGWIQLGKARLQSEVPQQEY